MATWWTYDLSDFLLFSAETYYRLFERYHRDAWPMQLTALTLGIAVGSIVWRRGGTGGRFAAAVLAAAWLWVAWAYHYQRYATINWAAPWFAALFAAEAVLLVWTGVVRYRIDVTAPAPAIRRAGLGLYGTALLGYPFVNPVLGREWAQVELFGMAPDPTAIATLGIVLFAPRGMRRCLLVPPVLWCAVSGPTLWAMQAPSAFLPPLAALVAMGAAIRDSASKKIAN